MVQFLFTNKDMESLRGLYRIMTNGFVRRSSSSLAVLLLQHQRAPQTCVLLCEMLP